MSWRYMIFYKTLLMYHTIKYLRVKQLIYRIYYRGYRLPSVRNFQLSQREWQNHWESSQWFSLPIIDKEEVVFLNEEGFVKQIIDWNDKNKTKLWLYNLHYFNALNAVDSDDNCSLLNGWIDKWIEHNPPYHGNGWEPYPLSLRIVNFILWFSRHNHETKSEWLVNLSHQAEALFNQIEFHILGNHLFANAKALVFAGAFFKGNRADCWLEKGLKILDKEIEEQFLRDGGHFELSPMYHAAMLWDMCDLVNLCQRSALEPLLLRKEQWISVVQEGLKWLAAMVHPDGDISFFNDATLGVAPTLNDLKRYVKKLGLKEKAIFSDSPAITWLKDSGYCVINPADDCKAIIDLGKIGPDYQPGHGHADILSFELSLFKQRIIVNSGISLYSGSPLRLQQRSTKYHSTVTVNDQSSSEVWADFRVGRRAHPMQLTVERGKDQSIVVNGAHDGYKRLPGKCIHHRQWKFSDNSMCILDVIDGNYFKAEACFYLHPRVKIAKTTNSNMELKLPDGKVILFSLSGHENFYINPSKWFPGFSLEVDNHCVVVELGKTSLITKIEW